MGYNTTVTGNFSGSTLYLKCNVVSDNATIVGYSFINFNPSVSGGGENAYVNATNSKDIDFSSASIYSNPDSGNSVYIWNIYVENGTYPNITYYTIPIMSYYPYNRTITYVDNGIEKTYVCPKSGTFESFSFTIDYDNIPPVGLSQLVTSGNIKAAVYNGTTYPPGATIPLDPSVENITLVNQNYTMTLNDTQNMKQVQIGNTIYKDFPVTQTLSENTVVNMSGKDDPVITVDYTNTGKPTVTNTKV